MKSQIKRAMSSAINGRFIPEIQNITRNLPLNHNGPEPSASLTEHGFGNAWRSKNTKFTKKDSRSACHLREDTDFTPYSYSHCYRNFLQQKISV